MNQLMKVTNILLTACCMAGCSSQIQISVENPIELPRENEIIEIPLQTLSRVSPRKGESLMVLDNQKKQIPCQITYDSLLIFPVSVEGYGKANYTICTGKPETTPTYVCGRQYPERLDDMTWENDKAAYRTYGPALEKTGERAFGFDILTKSVAEPVMEERYRMHLDPNNPRSYHVDHGNGMDCYSVGATLGGGTSALLSDSTIIYPYTYDTHEILDNGPLRFCVRLSYKPFCVGKDTAITETRLISLDLGSHLNKTEVIYNQLSTATPLVTGIVIHPQNPDGYRFNQQARYMAYADSTDCTTCENGVIFIGAVFQSTPERINLQWFDEKEQKEHAGALGHLLGGSTYHPGSSYIYYWGSGWSKAGISNMENWETYLKEYARKLEYPLRITYQ